MIDTKTGDISTAERQKVPLNNNWVVAFIQCPVSLVSGKKMYIFMGPLLFVFFVSFYFVYCLFHSLLACLSFFSLFSPLSIFPVAIMSSLLPAKPTKWWMEMFLSLADMLKTRCESWTSWSWSLAEENTTFCFTPGKPACHVLAESITYMHKITPEAWIGLSYNTAGIHFLSKDLAILQIICFYHVTKSCNLLLLTMRTGQSLHACG